MIDSDAASYPRMGLNVATVAVQMLAESLPPHRDRRIPYPRVAALVATVRGLPEHRTPDNDRRVLLPALDGPAQVVSLDELPLPPGTPPPIPLG